MPVVPYSSWLHPFMQLNEADVHQENPFISFVRRVDKVVFIYWLL